MTQKPDSDKLGTFPLKEKGNKKIGKKNDSDREV